MRTTTLTIICLLLFYYMELASTVTEVPIRNSNTIEKFLRLFTSLFNQTASSDYVSSFKERDLYTDYLNTINQQFANYYEQSNEPQSSRPSLGQQHPSKPSDYDRPGAVHSFYQPIPVGNLPVRPVLPPNYRPTFDSYPQISLIAALASIAKHDDLRCVPRLLCEVASGTITRSPKYKKDKSQIPFLTKDAFITLLTVLNFVDDSPILLFARAALLGYSTKGDNKACFTAYPTCPKDPDKLVDYLNNHNGGFFRFFNQQLQYTPQYQQSLRKRNNNDNDHNGNNNKRKKLRKNKTYNDERSKKSITYPRKYGFAPRIMNNPVNIETIDDYLSKITNTNQPTRDHKNKFVFLSTENKPKDLLTHSSDNYKLLFPTRSAKKISFPEKSGASNEMIFPDRTGTGNLILSDDSNGKYRIIFADEGKLNRRKNKIKFSTETKEQKLKTKFPQEEQHEEQEYNYYST